MIFEIWTPHTQIYTLRRYVTCFSNGLDTVDIQESKSFTKNQRRDSFCEPSEMRVYALSVLSNFFARNVLHFSYQEKLNFYW